MKHDFSDSDHCKNCGSEQDAYNYCSNAFNAPLNHHVGLWGSLSTHEERYIENHFEDYRDGFTENCDCSLCEEWRLQGR